MKITARLLPLLLFPVLGWGQTYTPATGTTVQNGHGTLLAGGTFCAVPYNSAGAVTAITPSGGSPSTGPFCSSITAGAFTASNIPNLTTATPSGLNYLLTVFDASSNVVMAWYGVQVSGASWSFDTYVLAPPILTQWNSAIGIGAPYPACSAGATWYRTDTSTNPGWQCKVAVSGYTQWTQSGSVSPTPGPDNSATIPVVAQMIADALAGGGGGGAVSSVFTRTGAVTAHTGDYSFAQISGVIGSGQLPVLTAAEIAAAGNLSNQAATAVALAAVPSQCSGGTPIASGIQANGNANCTTATGSGLNQLTGDVLAGPGAGSQPSTVLQVNGGVVPASAGVLGTNGSRQLIAQTNPQAVYPMVSGLDPYREVKTFGDSTVWGTGVPFGWQVFGPLLNRDVPGPLTNFGIPSYWTSDISSVVWLNWNNAGTSSTPFVSLQGGVNDAINVDTTGSQNNAKGAITSSAAHILIPIASQVMASSATAAGGWAATTGINSLQLESTISGTIMQSQYNGATLTYTLPAAANLVVWYVGQASNGGTFTVSVNGTLVNNYCTGTTTWNATGCNGQTITTPYNGGYGFLAQIVSGNAGGTNTVIITVTSATSGANLVYSVAAAPVITNSAASLLAIQGVQKLESGYIDSATADYNTTVSGVFSSLTGAGFTNVFFVDPRNGVAAGTNYPAARATNNTTDFVTTDANCGVPGSEPQHFNCQGYKALENIYVSAAAAASLPIALRNAGAPVTAPLLIWTPPTLPNTTDAYPYDMQLNPGAAYQGNSNHGPGICFFPNQTWGSRFSGKHLCNARIAFEFAADGVQQPSLKIHTSNSGISYPLTFCGTAGNVPDPTIGNDDCAWASFEGNYGFYSKYIMHLGSPGNYATSQPSVQAGNWAYSVESEGNTSGTPLNATYVYLQAGTSAYTVSACKAYSGDIGANWVQYFINNSGGTLASLTFSPATGNGDTLNGGSSNVVYTNVPANTMFTLRCSQANTNVWIQEITPNSSTLVSAPANTIFSNFTSSTAAPAWNSIASCVGSGNALNFTAGTGFSCNSAISATTALSSTTSGTATNFGGGSLGTVPYQSAASTTAQLAAPTTNGSYMLTENPVAGAAVAPVFTPFILAGSGAGLVTGPTTVTTLHMPEYIGTTGQQQDSGIAVAAICLNGHQNCPLATHQDYWNIASALFATSTAVGPVYFEMDNNSTAGTLKLVTARLSGTISCTVAPSVVILDLGTSVTTAYGSATVLTTLATGTSDGAYVSSTLSVAVTTGHYLGVGFSAGTCVTAPIIDVVASIYQ